MGNIFVQAEMPVQKKEHIQERMSRSYSEKRNSFINSEYNQEKDLRKTISRLHEIERIKKLRSQSIRETRKNFIKQDLSQDKEFQKTASRLLDIDNKKKLKRQIPLSSMAKNRILNEIKSLRQKEPNWRFLVDEQNITEWKVYLTLNKKTSPFHSIPIEIQVSFPNNYPEEVPLFKVTEPKKFFHPNIDQFSGYICDDTLKQSGRTITIRERVDGILHLLYFPNQNDPITPKAAKLIKDKGIHVYNFQALTIFRKK